MHRFHGDGIGGCTASTAAGADTGVDGGDLHVACKHGEGGFGTVGVCEGHIAGDDLPVIEAVAALAVGGDGDSRTHLVQAGAAAVCDDHSRLLTDKDGVVGEVAGGKGDGAALVNGTDIGDVAVGGDVAGHGGLSLSLIHI